MRLPTIRHKGKDYYIDWRLKQFRSVDPPLEFIPFDSKLGNEIDRQVEEEEALEAWSELLREEQDAIEEAEAELHDHLNNE